MCVRPLHVHKQVSMGRCTLGLGVAAPSIRARMRSGVARESMIRRNTDGVGGTCAPVADPAVVDDAVVPTDTLLAVRTRTRFASGDEKLFSLLSSDGCLERLAPRCGALCEAVFDEAAASSASASLRSAPRRRLLNVRFVMAS